MRSTNLTLLSLTTLLQLAHSQVICIQGILSTITYEPALVAHTTGDTASACPTDYYSATNAGCCVSSATPHVVNSGVACCPCGADCTGYFPAPMAWESKDGRLVLTATESGSTVVMTKPTNSVATPWHGPTTGTGSVIPMSTAPGPVSVSSGSPLPYSSSPTPANATIHSTSSSIATTTTGTNSGFIGSSTGTRTASSASSSSSGAATQTASAASSKTGMEAAFFAGVVGVAFLGLVAV